MQKVYISSAVRTPLGTYQGNLAGFSEQKLAAMTLLDLVKKVDLDPIHIDEIIIGNAKQTSNPSNLARHAQLLAELPVEIPAYTVQRQSSSGLQAIINAYLAIASGNSSIIAAGGSESMSQIPLEVRKARFAFGADTEIIFDPLGNQLKGAQPDHYGALQLADVDRNIAEQYQITDQEIEMYLDDSLKKSSLSKHKDHLLPVEVKKKKEIISVTEDQQYDSPSAIAKPADGAAMCLLCSESAAAQYQLPVKAEITAIGFDAGDPGGAGWIGEQMISEVLKKAGLTINELDLIEISEVSAAQILAARKVLKKLGMTEQEADSKVNSWGGTLLTGLSWGAAGAVLLNNLLYQLHEEKKQYGMVVTPAEGGQTLAVVISAK